MASRQRLPTHGHVDAVPRAALGMGPFTKPSRGRWSDYQRRAGSGLGHRQCRTPCCGMHWAQGPFTRHCDWWSNYRWRDSSGLGRMGASGGGWRHGVRIMRLQQRLDAA